MVTLSYSPRSYLGRVIILLLCQLKSGNATDGTTAVQLSEFVWKTSNWSECYSSTDCGNGEKFRSVWCENKDGYKSQVTNCNPETKPTEKTACFKICKRHKNSLRWRTGRWGKCKPLSNTKYCTESPGMKTRMVMCVHKTNNNRKHYRTMEDEACLNFRPKPPTNAMCTMNCPQGCIVSSFGKWSNCSVCSASNRTRTRKVLVAPEKGGSICPHLTESERCIHSRECLRHTHIDNDFILKLGAWGPCTSSSNYTSNISRQPIVGYRTRNVSCINGMGETVHLSWCTKRSPLAVSPIESCIIPRDCTFTEWNDWVLVKEGCVTSSGQTFPDLKERYRKVIHLSEGDGKLCPPLVERRFVADKLGACRSRYKWMHSSWNECIPYESVCGGGIQRRNMFCVKIRGLVPVQDSYCKEIRSPVLKQCSIECPRKCIVSPWSSWGPCLLLDNKDTSQSAVGYRERRRKIIQEPSADQKECPSLVEVDSCHDPVVVRWLTGNWSMCILRDITQTCGEGVRKRDAVCVSPTGVQVSSSLCETKVLPPKLLAPCYIPCPRDCVLTEWSEWSSCTVSCTSSGNGGIKTRQRKIIAEQGSGGKPCPSLDSLNETDSCGYESCSGYHWKRTEWSTCQVLRNRSCGEGTQSRKVMCVRSNKIIVSDRKCIPEPKPQTQRSCEAPCPVDCIVTNYTEWSPCVDECRTAKFGYGECKRTSFGCQFKNSIQRRWRYILQPALYGGAVCPDILEDTRLCDFRSDPRCMKKFNSSSINSLYRWNVATWSDCILANGLQCGVGYQVRKVSCIRKNGREVQINYCLSLQIVPESSRSCYHFCNKSCSLSEWLPWSSYNGTNCPTNRIRTRQAIGNMCGQETLREIEAFPLPEIINTSEDHWSDCIINKDKQEMITINNQQVGSNCGAGERFIKGNKIDSCTQKGFVKDMCVKECPESCHMSEWSEWSHCNVTCGQGYKRRQRYVLKYSNKLGRSCPVLNGDAEVQESVCDMPCDHYQWVAGDWTDCDLGPFAIEKCGNGIRKRTVSCRKVKGKQISRQLDEMFCDETNRPPHSDQCTISCPDDCVVSSWSNWSKCPQPCSHHQSRHRNRTVLRMALPSSGTRCPVLPEEEVCKLGVNCFHYKWKIDDWSSCILPEKASCGQGMRTRAANCVRNDGQYVTPEHCQKFPLPELMNICSVDCPIDCEISDWTDWNVDECKPCNTKGQRWRSRELIQEASKTGQPCPTDFIQRVPCPYTPCYHWSFSRWSDCLLQGAQCGYGIRRRNVDCIRTDGVSAHREKCLRINVTEFIGGWVDARWLEKAHDVQETEICEVTCLGGCEFTPWSTWSYCHRNCKEGSVVGYQTRSRAILSQDSSSKEKCSENLWERRPCWDGPCLTYNWKLKDGSIQCVRSDGLIALGGCDTKPRPCYPECNLQYAVCDHMTGKCVCLPGTVPVFNSSMVRRGDAGQVFSCVVMNTMDAGYRPTTNHTTTTEEIILKYFPDDNEFNFWMYAMICVGCAFVIFVIVTIYLMCSQKTTTNRQETHGFHMKLYRR